MSAFHRISQEDQSWALYEVLGDLILVVVTLRWLLRVVVRVTLTPHVVVATPHVVVAFAVFLKQFVEDPLTIIGFLVPMQRIFLLDTVARKKRIDIPGR